VPAMVNMADLYRASGRDAEAQQFLDAPSPSRPPRPSRSTPLACSKPGSGTTQRRSVSWPERRRYNPPMPAIVMSMRLLSSPAERQARRSQCWSRLISGARQTAIF
jgi:hypothetical protein